VPAGNAHILSTLPPTRGSKGTKGKSGKKSKKDLVSQAQTADVSTPNKGKTMALSAFATVGVLGVVVGMIFVVRRVIKRRRRSSSAYQ
jgi:flagellar biogenesis protein FliO